jgi:hypothetical protein
MKRPRVRISTLMLLVVIAALVCVVGIQGHQLADARAKLAAHDSNRDFLLEALDLEDTQPIYSK